MELEYILWLLFLKELSFKELYNMFVYKSLL